MLSGAANNRNATKVFEHSIKLIIGPFPWTQYFDGSIEGYAPLFNGRDSPSAWHMTIIYFLVLRIRIIFRNEYSKNFFFIVLLFGVPAVFSLGGMNIYLLPSSRTFACIDASYSISTIFHSFYYCDFFICKFERSTLPKSSIKGFPMKILMLFVDMLRPNRFNVYDKNMLKNAVDHLIKDLGGTLYSNCFSPAPDTCVRWPVFIQAPNSR